jgi:hypothetical protein
MAREAVHGLVGLGPGSTPAGDDFLCGVLLALRCTAAGEGPREAYLLALQGAVEQLLERTTDLSGTFLRCALRALAPSPLGEAAGAIALGRTQESVDALARLCSLGHSSGADLGTGFLYGLSMWSGVAAGVREERASPSVRRQHDAELPVPGSALPG